MKRIMKKIIGVLLILPIPVVLSYGAIMFLIDEGVLPEVVVGVVLVLMTLVGINIINEVQK